MIAQRTSNIISQLLKTLNMFTDQDIDYSLNRPCRTLSAVAPASKPSSAAAPKAADDGGDGDGGGAEDGGWEDDDDDYYPEASAALADHRFLVGSAIPSVSKLRDDDDDDDDEGGGGGGIVVGEDYVEEGRTVNRLHLLQYREDGHELSEKSSWAHPTGEVWAMGCHPSRGDWVVTCGGGAAYSNAAADDAGSGGGVGRTGRIPPPAKFRTILWRVPDPDDDGGCAGDGPDHPPRLEPIVVVPHGARASRSSPPSSGWEQRVGQILWNPLLAPPNSSGDEHAADPSYAPSNGGGGGGDLLTVGWDARSSPISLWDVSSQSDAGGAREVWSAGGDGGGGGRSGGLAALVAALPRRASWDPHDANRLLATSGADVVSYDTRCPASGGGAGAIRSAHRYGVADVCHNHSQPNVVVTAGMDGVVKFWDLRMHASGGGDDGAPSLPTAPLLKVVRGGHSHWATRAVYNPFHDQLVLTGGSDGIANLWRISSCSSAPLLELNGDEEDDGETSEGGGGNDMEDGGSKDAANEGEEYTRAKDYWAPKSDDGEDESEGEDRSKSSRDESNAQDIRVTRFECSDVTADLAWSAADPWVYATLSYDGAIVVHHVPSKEKYKILL